MKRLLLLTLLCAVPVLGGWLAYETLPYFFYHRLVSGKWRPELYRLGRWEKSFLLPNEVRGVGKSEEEFASLWREFHLADVIVPLPAGHPLFQTIPIITPVPAKSSPQIGVKLVRPSGREIARIYWLNSGAWSDQLDAQGLFKLPLVRRGLKEKKPEDVWRDLFTKKIVGWDLPWSEMLYNLYLLHLRSIFLPPGHLAYGAMDTPGKAYVEIPSLNKDYRTEIVFSFIRGLLMSYVLVTERGNPDSEGVRAKFLNGINFRASDSALSSLIYREFKQLSFLRQTDQEGMLYLFSAWSHSLEDQEMLKEMIYYLERGSKSAAQLKPIYRYALTRYQKTFTTRDVNLELDDDDVRLQRQIELEGVASQEKLTGTQKVTPLPTKVAPRDQMDEYLKRAREEKLAPTARKRRDKILAH